MPPVQEPKPAAFQLKPKVPVPERVNGALVPNAGVMVTVAAFAPSETGAKLIAPVVQVWPMVRLAFKQVPEATVKSVLSLRLNGLPLNTIGPSTAVTVTLPAPHEVLEPTVSVPHASEVGVACAIP